MRLPLVCIRQTSRRHSNAADGELAKWIFARHVTSRHVPSRLALLRSNGKRRPRAGQWPTDSCTDPRTCLHVFSIRLPNPPRAGVKNASKTNAARLTRVPSACRRRQPRSRRRSKCQNKCRDAFILFDALESTVRRLFFGSCAARSRLLACEAA